MVPAFNQPKERAEIKKLIKEELITKLEIYTSVQFAASSVTTPEKKGSDNLAIDSKSTKSQIFCKHLQNFF